MNYDNVIELLLKNFPEIRMQDNEHLLELPHCIFDIMFVPYILKMCDEKNEDVLYAIGLFLEKMATSTDKKVKELLSVSVLEPLVLENRDISMLQRHIFVNTQNELEYWIRVYKSQR